MARGTLSALACAAALVGTALAQASDPASVANRAIAQLVSQPRSADLWSYGYGPSIEMSAMFEASTAFPGQNWSSAVSAQLDAFIADATTPAAMILANQTIPWGSALGDKVGLFPIAYLARADFEGNTDMSSTDWQIALRTADQFLLQWPYRLADGTVSRHQGWPNEPDGGNGTFLWDDDLFMGTSLLARLAQHPAVPSSKALRYLNFIALQHVNFAAHNQDPATGFFWHGTNNQTGDHSCCYWGRANGWTMMARAEVVTALTKVAPSHPALPAILGIWKKHATALKAVQNPDPSAGLWHQVLDQPSTFLETSASAMIVFSLAEGVLGGWLDQATYDAPIRAGWNGIASMVDAAGIVYNISCGTGIGTSVSFYEQRSTNYTQSSPGLGSVFRAAIAVKRYQDVYGA